MLSAFRIGGRRAGTSRAGRRFAGGRVILALVVGGLMTSARAEASTVLYRTDAQLVASSDRVVHGEVLDVRAEWAADGHTIYTVARVAVLEDFTGGSDPVIEVRVPGGVMGAVQVWVAGMPRFAPGQQIVLCLERQGTGWRTTAFEFSTFHVQPQADGDPMLVRDVDGSHVVGAPSTDDRARRLSAFRRIAASVKRRGSVRPGGERLVAEAEAVRKQAEAAAQASGAPVSAPFTLLANMRWRQADTDTPVVWYRNTNAAAPVMDPNVDGRITTALQSWTEPATSRLTLSFGGTRLVNGPDWECPTATANGGLITFEDPYNDMGASVLAYGGGCSGPANHTVNGTLFSGISHGFVIFNNASDAPSLTNPTSFTRVLAHELGHGIGLGHTCENNPSGGFTGPACSAPMRVNLMYPSCCFTETPVPPAIGPDDLAAIEFVYPMPSTPSTDTDGDTLLDAWETDFGLNPSSATGDNGRDGDPDGDGVPNWQEQANGTHPRGFEKRYFAEGVVNAFFETQIALLNPGSTTAIVLLRLQPQGGAELAHRVEVPANTRRTVSSATLGALTGAPFATLIESDRPVVADRTVAWGAGAYGSHTETAVRQPATTWYLAEGATGGGFELFYLLQNSNAADVQVDITYLLSDGAPRVKRYTVPARSRVTIAVDNEEIPAGSGQRPLISTDVSAKVDVVNGGGPVIVERAMYYTVTGGQPFGAGHESAGVPELGQDRRNWFFAEGATGSFFDTYLLLANPGSSAAHVNATYLLTDGTTYSKMYTVGPQSRFTIWLDDEQIPAGSGNKPLARVDVSTTFASDVPIIAERSMWWPDGQWYEAHNTAGATSFGTRWAIADGEVGGSRNAQTFLLVANVSDQPANLRVTLLTETGTSLVWPSAAAGQTIPAHSRLTIPIDTAHFPTLNTASQKFGAVIDSLPPGGGLPSQPIVVERANYYNVGGITWASGGAALASNITP